MMSGGGLDESTALRCVAEPAVRAMKVLANEDRLLIVHQLSRGELCVGELERLLGIHQPTLSQQLGILRAERVVATRREGKQVFYRIADARLLEILATLHRFYAPPA